MSFKTFIKLYSVRILSVIFWLILSISSFQGWRLLASSLKPEDQQIWLSHNAASLLEGSWILFAVAVVGLSLLYIYELKNGKQERLSHVLLWIALLGLAAIFIYPLGSLDHFAYVAYSRLHAHYGLNPYYYTVSSISDYLNDPFLKNMWWINVSSVYGPLWTWISFALYRMSSASGLIPLIFIFKLIGLFMHLLITIVVYHLAEVISAGRGTRAALLYGMNPLAIFEFIVNAHNDGLAVLLLLVSLILLVKKRYLKGFLVAGMSAACKLTVGIAILFKFWRTAKEKGIWHARLCTIVAILLIALLYLTLFSGEWEGIINALRNPLSGFISNSIVTIPHTFGLDQLEMPVRNIGLIIFGFLYIFLLRKSQTVNTESFLILVGLGFMAYYLFGAYVVHRWYYLWPLAIMAAVPDSLWTRVIIGQTLLMLISYNLILVFGEKNEVNAITYMLNWLPLIHLWMSNKNDHGFWEFNGSSLKNNT